MKDADLLIKHGWKLLRRQKMGCMTIADWIDPHDGQIRRQGVAVQIQSDRNRQRKMALRKNEMLRQS